MLTEIKSPTPYGYPLMFWKGVGLVVKLAVLFCLVAGYAADPCTC